MGMRFQRRIKIAPGVRINLSLGGVSASVGVRGASATLGKQGLYANAGIPGTGLSMRNKVKGFGGFGRNSAGVNAPSVQTAVELSLLDDGNVRMVNKMYGNEISGAEKSRLWKQSSSAVIEWLNSACDELNAVYDGIYGIHLKMVKPRREVAYARKEYGIPEPLAPRPPEKFYFEWPVGFAWWFSASKRKKAADDKAAAIEAHKAAVAEYERESEVVARNRAHWQQGYVKHNLAEDEIALTYTKFIVSDLNTMYAALDRAYMAVDWPRETLIDYDIRDNGRCVALDVDLPEIEDMPVERRVVSDTGRRLLVKKISSKAAADLYARHVHGVLLRVVSVVFSELPLAETVIVSGYTQREIPTKFGAVDEYVLSASISRSAFEVIDFNNLGGLCPIAAFELFDTRREFSRGKLKTIIPFG